MVLGRAAPRRGDLIDSLAMWAVEEVVKVGMNRLFVVGDETGDFTQWKW